MTVLEWLRNYLIDDPFDWKNQATVLLNLVVITWSLHVINWGLCGGGLIHVLGLHPRLVRGLPGIASAHFLHGVKGEGSDRNSHLNGNTLAFAPLAWAILLQGIKFFWVVTIAVALTSGIGTWLWGRDGPHVGASGIIFGYIGFLLTFGLTSGSLPLFLLSVLVLVLYGRTISNILPGIPVSWEMHLFGFIGGVVIALILSDIRLSY